MPDDMTAVDEDFHDGEKGFAQRYVTDNAPIRYFIFRIYAESMMDPVWTLIYETDEDGVYSEVDSETGVPHLLASVPGDFRDPAVFTAVVAAIPPIPY
jgi:hypothetical protein